MHDVRASTVSAGSFYVSFTKNIGRELQISAVAACLPIAIYSVSLIAIFPPPPIAEVWRLRRNSLTFF